MALSVGPVNTPTLNQNAPVQQSNIRGVITATPGSNGFVGFAQPGGGGAPQNVAPANNNGGGGGRSTVTPAAAAAPVYQDKTNDIAVQNAGLGQVDSQTQAGINAINSALGHITDAYGKETTANETNYGNESNSNMNSLQGGKQTAYVNAAHGRQGLLATLASIGALSGDSIEEANQAVQNGANTDLHGVTNTFSTNQSALDQAIGTYRRENQARIDTANTEADNSRKAETAKGAQTKQSFLTNLANDYQAEGKAPQGKTYSDQAAALYPLIAANNVPSGNIAPQTAAYTAPLLSTYLGGNNTAVTTTPAPGNTPGTLPALSAISGKKQTSLAVAWWVF